ncbi:MAG: hypothetical protein RQ842_10470 [Vulcanisaeta sp.]|nr:hypothetical protein [Vulcanisaeta sp.]
MSEEPYEIEEYPPYEFEVEKRPGEHVRVRSRRVEEWGEEESESELPITAYYPYEEFVLPASALAGAGSALTGLGIAQVLNKGVAQMLLKTLPLLTAKVSLLSIPIPIVSIIGVGLIGLALLLIVKAREVVIKL